MLINWMFFWDTGDWTPGSVSVSATAAPVVVDLGAGGGHQYDSEYWDVREEHIRRHLPREADQHTKETVVRKELPVKQRVVVPIPQRAEDFSVLQDKLGKMSLQLGQIELESDDEAVLALLL